MKRDWHILLPGGSREGPYAEEELLDFLDAGEIAAETQCHHATSGRTTTAGALFRVVPPVVTAPASKPVHVPWEPAPFPGEKPAAAGSATPRVRLIYNGHPCVLCYWRSAVLASALGASGALLKENVPALLAAGLLAAAGVLLQAVLHRMSAHYILTSTRVESRRGLAGPRSRELRIVDTRAISITGSGFPGIGTITFAGPASPTDDVVFLNVWRPGWLKLTVRKLQAGIDKSSKKDRIM